MELESILNGEAGVVPRCGTQVEFFVGCAETTTRSRLLAAERKRSDAEGISNVFRVFSIQKRGLL